MVPENLKGGQMVLVKIVWNKRPTNSLIFKIIGGLFESSPSPNIESVSIMPEYMKLKLTNDHEIDFQEMSYGIAEALGGRYYLSRN